MRGLLRFLVPIAAMLMGASSALTISWELGLGEEAWSEGSAGGGGPALDLTAPLAGVGVAVTPDEVAELVAFAPVDVSPLGTPDGVFVTDPRLAPQQARVVAWTFDHPTYGAFVLIQEPSQTTQEELESLAGCDPASGCQGSWSLVELASGRRALLIEGPASTALIWLDGGRRLTAMGPSGTFFPASAEAVAEALQGPGP